MQQAAVRAAGNDFRRDSAHPGESGGVTQPWGHHLDGRDIKPTQLDNAPSMGPAGTVHCSVPDWAKFAALHLAGEHGNSKLLKPATLQTLHIPPPSCEYAGGWTVAERSWAGGTALNHNGSNTSLVRDHLAGAGAESRNPGRDQPGRQDRPNGRATRRRVR